MEENSRLKPEEIVAYFKEEFKAKVKESRIERRVAGVNKNEYVNIWIKIDKSIFKKAVKHLCSLQFPHLAVVSGNDLGKNIELIYHFSLYYGERLGEISLNLSVEIPKSNPTIETICDIIPGALTTEREKQEMLGVKISGIPDSRRLFLPDDFPEGIYPWRKDETGPQKMVRNLNEVRK
ncbi:NADH-quinone oxidoreductase subunit F [Euryarchaeota archaeon ex4484_162]|nr:MAG: NADH-quinone oxidoreductase subunit F [Euryarchaeota archaeon ex4484_162]RLC46135.1 MAG: NADH-quinone oxidoreductase subunit C [Candidatus Cloacimonadota bacterium]RLF27746.1 MAG: NADH-quinone oxidoreductase subunit C [Thermoplasmata archaeon]